MTAIISMSPAIIVALLHMAGCGHFAFFSSKEDKNKFVYNVK